MMYRLPVKLSLFEPTRPELSKLNTNRHQRHHRAGNHCELLHVKWTEKKIKFFRPAAKRCWRHVNFGTGKIIFLDITQKEDMLQVEYPNGFLLDMGWYQDRYIISIIQNFDWTHPVQQYETAERNQLPKLLTEAVRLVEKESQSAGAN